ncbi:MAG: Rpn family recombination-promoting nuclease/putative transposase [Limosilactobacillus sp.]|jgi:predicted transposase/invertase (TIGR01784 family)|uniref:PD-(D/E)XK nuclease family transposase n=1 Tax=Limosilactobacillus sp. TaxID=2773925 RepID=UPI0025BD5AC4|nr:PD-(D/E)XK nuclease family transposase [Limosilactobacillus sp.]MCI1975399.1 Rpn family recombination-promoting nuclease/putative transposase [Limosilactobacillus sp.]
MEQTSSRKSWEEAGLTDDFIFSKTFLDPEITLGLLRRIFPTMAIKGIKILNSQQEIKTTHDAKSSRFDIYVEDYDNRHYDVEMQVKNNHNLPQRNRFYQSSLATATYTKGKTTSKPINHL